MDVPNLRKTRGLLRAGLERGMRRSSHSLEPEAEASSVLRQLAEVTSWSGWSGIESPPKLPSREPLTPGILKQTDVLSSDFWYWMTQLKEQPSLQNKQWQYFMVLQSAYALLDPSPAKRAIGFGVGREPLPALLASWGWSVVASDYFDGDHAVDWSRTDQMVSARDDLNDRAICPPREFDRLCSLENIDMNTIPPQYDGGFDLVWSLCALGHIGGYWAGLDFVRSSLRLLRPGGIAVHTTEMDLSSDLVTLDTPGLSLYRRRDLEQFLEDVRNEGYVVRLHDFNMGPGILENYVDAPPFGPIHLTLDVLGHQVAAVSLVIQAPDLDAQ
jgi:hypothetical protein